MAASSSQNAALGENPVPVECNVEKYQFRALICAEAVYRKTNEEVRRFLKETQRDHPSVRFEKVHVSLELSKKLKFLVAYAEDATFIAFRGSPDSKDNYAWYLEKLIAIEGIHKGAFARANVFTGPDYKIFNGLLSENGFDRVIFCGQLMGGAVAHTVLLRFLLQPAARDENGRNERFSEGQASHNMAPAPQSSVPLNFPTGRMISIAFAAPDICIDTVANVVNKNGDLKKLFFNLILAAEPRVSPIILANSARPGLAVFHSIGETKYLLARDEMRDVLPRSAEDWKHEEFYESCRFALIKAESFIVQSSETPDQPADVVVSTPAPKVFHATKKALDNTGTPIIQITGENLLFLTKDVNINGTESWKTNVQKDREVWILAPDSYAKSSEAIEVLAVTTAFGSTTHVMRAQECKDNEGAGTVSKLLRRIVQICLIEATPPMCSMPSTDFQKILDSIVQRVPALKNKKEPLSKLLRKIARDLDSSQAEAVTQVVKKANDMVTKVIEYLTNSFELLYTSSHAFAKSKAQLTSGVLTPCGFETMHRMWGNTESAVSPSTGSKLNRCSCSNMKFCLTVLGSHALCVLCGSNILGLLLCALGVFVILSPRVAMIPEYADVLIIAIREVSDWCKLEAEMRKPGGLLVLEAREGSQSIIYQLQDLLQNRSEPLTGGTPRDNGNHDKSRIVAKLECLLYKTVTSDEKYFNILLENQDEVLSKTKNFSPLFDGATIDTKQKLLNKMKIVKDTIFLQKIQEKKRFIGVVGEEDAGKTTFIKKALLRCIKSGDADKLKTGYDEHTQNVRCYNLDGATWLVDFPGSNGIKEYANEWKQFTAVPDSCVLLLNFQGDIKREQCILYETMKKELGADITVVFNKVDEKFTGRTKSEFTKEKFAELRDSASKSVGIKTEEEKVHFACLDPEDDSKMLQLRELGVLACEELVKKVLWTP